MSEAPVRIQLRRTKGWKMPPDTVKVDRSTGFGNPFPIAKAKSTSQGVTTDSWMIGTWSGPAIWFAETKERAAEMSVTAFRAWAVSDAYRQAARRALAGKNLACWCKLPKPGEPDICHAAVLLEIANK